VSAAAEGRPGEALFARIVAENVGAESWGTREAPDRHTSITYHVKSSDGSVLSRDAEHTPVYETVEPGDMATLYAYLVTPNEPGEYIVEWGLRAGNEPLFTVEGSRLTPLRVIPADPHPSRESYLPRTGHPLDKPIEDVSVAVTVLTWNPLRTQRVGLLERTLRSLALGGHPFHRVLVDNGSDDGSSELIASLGGIKSTKTGGAGIGMTTGISEALKVGADVVICSDDDIEWRPNFIRDVVRFWRAAPPDVVLLGGHLEPPHPWISAHGVIECNGVRAFARANVPGGSWTFLAKNWGVVGPLDAGMQGDWKACGRLSMAGYRFCSADLAVHLGEEQSTWREHSR
jgi:hypothetical protein